MVDVRTSFSGVHIFLPNIMEFICDTGISPSTKFLSLQKFVWAPAR